MDLFFRCYARARPSYRLRWPGISLSQVLYSERAVQGQFVIDVFDNQNLIPPPFRNVHILHSTTTTCSSLHLSRSRFTLPLEKIPVTGHHLLSLSPFSFISIIIHSFTILFLKVFLYILNRWEWGGGGGRGIFGLLFKKPTQFKMSKDGGWLLDMEKQLMEKTLQQTRGGR